MKVKELKKELKKKGLITSGTKTQLIERLTGNIWTFSYTPPGNFLTGPDNIWVSSVQGNYSMVRRHIHASKMESGYNIDQLSPYGRTALHQACLGGNINIILFLIKEGSLDLNGSAYLSSSRGTRKIMSKFGFKGESFICLPQVKLLQAKRNLVLSQIDIDYDVLSLIVESTRKCFTSKESHHSVLRRFNNSMSLF